MRTKTAKLTYLLDDTFLSGFCMLLLIGSPNMNADEFGLRITLSEKQ
jgi:hypothetical protein